MIQEAISGVEVVKSYAMEKKEVARVASKLQNVMRTRIARSVLMAFASSFMSGTMFGLTIIVMFFGAFDILAGRMTIGDYVAFITYIMFLSNAVNMLYRTYLTFQPAFASMDRLKEMFDIAPEFEWGQQSMKQPGQVKGNVRFENVSFSYGSEPTLKNISFEVRPGETVALVGHSGAGKTTLVSLLLKLYIPRSGRITLDGVTSMSSTTPGCASRSASSPRTSSCSTTRSRTTSSMAGPTLPGRTSFAWRRRPASTTSS